jgi:adenylate cyclase
VRGFTTLSEKMPPAQLIGYLNRLLEMVSDCILGQGGTIDKFMGDGIMAFWNAPVEDPRHAAHAIAATLAIDTALREMNRRFEEEGLPTARMGFGLNTGTCNVGLMGHAKRLDYSCIGDTVNVAARIQDITKTFGVWNCVTLATVAQAPEFCAVEIDVSPIRGRDRQEPLFTVLGPKEMNADPKIAAFREALAAVRAARDAHAERAFEEALRAVEENTPEGIKADALSGWFRKSMQVAA